MPETDGAMSAQDGAIVFRNMFFCVCVMFLVLGKGFSSSTTMVDSEMLFRFVKQQFSKYPIRLSVFSRFEHALGNDRFFNVAVRFRIGDSYFYCRCVLNREVTDAIPNQRIT